MWKQVESFSYICANGHVWSKEQFFQGNLKEPYETTKPVDPARLAYRVVIGEGAYSIVALPEGQRKESGVFTCRRKASSRRTSANC